MCVCFVSFGQNPKYPLIIAHNRDEYYARPTAAAAFWDSDPEIFGGRDLLAGGTWLGLNTRGSIALITNYRDPKAKRESARSRGHIVNALLESKLPMTIELQAILEKSEEYNEFSTLAYGEGKLWYASSPRRKLEELNPGSYALSNHELNTPWPKVQKISEQGKLIAQQEENLIEGFLALMADTTAAPDEELPSTGVGLDLERLLSPIFIKTETYGTRCSTVILVENSGKITFFERSFSPTHTPSDVVEKFDLYPS